MILSHAFSSGNPPRPGRHCRVGNTVLGGDPCGAADSYLATYLERDVRSLANVGSLRDFERFLRACALRSANLLNKADLARDVGVAPSTANHLVVHSGGFWPDRIARTMVLESHQVHRQESQTLPGGYRPALCAAEHPLRRSSGSNAGGRRRLGNVHLCPIARARAPRRTHGESVLLA